MKKKSWKGLMNFFVVLSWKTNLLNTDLGGDLEREIHKLVQTMRGALVLKLLGTMISYHMLDQRLLNLWTLEKGLKLTDLAENYFIVHFFCREDYMHILEGGPWTILGHYLTVMKWRPKFIIQRRRLRRLLFGCSSLVYRLNS